jgi:hypothetical protein
MTPSRQISAEVYIRNDYETFTDLWDYEIDALVWTGSIYLYFVS